MERGARIDQRARAAVAHIGGKVAEREIAVVLSRMNWPAADGSVSYRATPPDRATISS